MGGAEGGEWDPDPPSIPGDVSIIKKPKNQDWVTSPEAPAAEPAGGIHTENIDNTAFPLPIVILSKGPYHHKAPKKLRERVEHPGSCGNTRPAL